MTNMVISLQLNLIELELVGVDQGVGLVLAQVSFSISSFIFSFAKSIFKFCLKLKNTKTIITSEPCGLEKIWAQIWNPRENPQLWN